MYRERETERYVSPQRAVPHSAGSSVSSLRPQIFMSMCCSLSQRFAAIFDLLRVTVAGNIYIYIYIYICIYKAARAVNTSSNDSRGHSRAD